jgi:formate hydrogenlyase transcriptional activator
LLALGADLLPVGPEPQDGDGCDTSPAASPSLANGARLSTLDDAERAHIEAALTETHWVIEGPHGAAELLEVHPNTLRSRMKRLGLRRPASRPGR